MFDTKLEAFPRIGEEHAIHESWRQARSAKGDDGNERRPRAGSDGKVNERKGLFSPSHHSVRLSFPFKSTQLSPKKVIASHWGRGSSS